MSGATIKIFLVHGDPKRLRTAELTNWTIQAVAGPRNEFEGVAGREESGRSGVYFLTGNDPESGKPALYVGEAENIRDRIKAHLEKDFWNQIVHFTSKDDILKERASSQKFPWPLNMRQKLKDEGVLSVIHP